MGALLRPLDSAGARIQEHSAKQAALHVLAGQKAFRVPTVREYRDASRPTLGDTLEDMVGPSLGTL